MPASGFYPKRLLISSTLHCRGKNGSSKKIGQTTQKMIRFVPNMYVSGRISALRPCTQTVKNFWYSKKNPKKYQTDEILGFAGFVRFFFLRGFAGFLPDRLRRCKYFRSFVSPSLETCNQSLKIDCLVFWVKSVDIGQAPKKHIFLGFGGSRFLCTKRAGKSCPL